MDMIWCVGLGGLSVEGKVLKVWVNRVNRGKHWRFIFWVLSIIGVFNSHANLIPEKRCIKNY